MEYHKGFEGYSDVVRSHDMCFGRYLLWQIWIGNSPLLPGWFLWIHKLRKTIGTLDFFGFIDDTICTRVTSRDIGDVIRPLIGNPFPTKWRANVQQGRGWAPTSSNWHINPYYWVDDHPLLYANGASSDPSTFYILYLAFKSWQAWRIIYYQNLGGWRNIFLECFYSKR